ncbi:DUF11 domain-containing protein [Candidatus Amarobacter glycogenicus]|uniref:DUF11 domain-containing protein n=1 Tax=Candidatus Amarobacter glycogenicus TaxID=3140699 RepID=UPI0031370DB4|nr:DUF11 domain-containing protein [Dehalococcoidia bacterium]
MNSATAATTTPDPDPSDNTDTAQVGVTALADLMVTKFASPAGPVPAGTPIVYTFYVDNLGPSTASGVAFADAVTSNGNFVINSITTDRPATCTPATPTAPANSRTVDCALTGNLEPQSAGTGRWTITVTITANSAQTLNNIATVESTTPDPDPSNNEDELNRDVTDLADLAIVKNGPALPVAAGTNTVFTMVVTNNGPSAATNVVMGDDLPAGLNYVSAVASGGGVCALVPTNRVECAWGSIPAAGVRTVTLIVNVDANYPAGVIHNTGTVNSRHAGPQPLEQRGSAGPRRRPRGRSRDRQVRHPRPGRRRQPPDLPAPRHEPRPERGAERGRVRHAAAADDVRQRHYGQRHVRSRRRPEPRGLHDRLDAAGSDPPGHDHGAGGSEHAAGGDQQHRHRAERGARLQPAEQHGQ